MLDLIQLQLQSNGISFRRIDGQTKLRDRGEAMKQFTQGPSCTVMLATIGSAGEG
jgi:SNF2 family DNA or RNA helicase